MHVSFPHLTNLRTGTRLYIFYISTVFGTKGYLRCELNAVCLYLLISNGNNNRKWLAIICIVFVAKQVLLKWYNSFNAFLSSHLGDQFADLLCVRDQSHCVVTASGVLFVPIPSLSAQSVLVKKTSSLNFYFFLLRIMTTVQMVHFTICN